MAFDFKKEYKEFYLPKDAPSVVDVPEMRCIAVRGRGDPDAEGGEYKASIACARALGYETDFSDARLHHEIYLSDPRKAAPEKLKTVIRHPIRPAEV